MLKLCTLVLTAALIHLPAGSSWAAERDHRLKGRVIRALAVEPGNPDHILVGQKGRKTGSGLVFKSRDGAKSWRTQNGNRALAPKATDVQAVLAFSSDLLLAGTWKHGLYVSRDAGARFARLEGFPSKDIRDLQTDGTRIFAATARHGIFVSEDQAKTWTAIGPNKDFLWSIALADGALYASSLETGVHRWQDGKWERIFKQDKANAFSAASHRRAAAGEAGLYIAEHGPWRRTLKGEKFAEVLMPDNGTILAGSWSNGLAVVAPGGRLQKRLLKGKAVIHLQISGDKLLAGTWGDGLHVIPLSQVIRERTPLIDAVLKNDTKEISRLLEAGADPNGFDTSRNTPLIFAARDGQLEIARLLIEAGAKPGWVDGEQVTPLILAAFRDHIDVVKLLLSHKVDRTQRDKWGRTATDYARRRGEDDAIYKLLTAGP